MDKNLETVEIDLNEEMIDFIYKNDELWEKGDLPDGSHIDGEYYLWMGENEKLYLTDGKTEETKCVKYLRKPINFKKLCENMEKENANNSNQKEC